MAKSQQKGTGRTRPKTGPDVSYSCMGFDNLCLMDALTAVAEAGFSCTEIFGHPPHMTEPPTGGALKEMLKRLRALSLRVCSVHAPMGANVPGMPEEGPRRKNLALLSRFVEFAAAVGAAEVIVHPVPNPCFVPDAAAPDMGKRIEQSLRRSMEELLPLTVSAHVRILLENLPYLKSGFPLLTMKELSGWIVDFPPERLGLIIDTGHAGTLGLDPAAEIRAAGARLGGTHLQDVPALSPNDEHWLPTHGDLDWNRIREALREVHYTGAWTFEAHNGRHGETPAELARAARSIAVGWGLLPPLPPAEGR